MSPRLIIGGLHRDARGAVRPINGFDFKPIDRFYSIHPASTGEVRGCSPFYKECEVIGGAVAEYLHRRGICLPSSSSLSTEDQQFVIDRVREAARVHA